MDQYISRPIFVADNVLVFFLYWYQPVHASIGKYGFQQQCIFLTLYLCPKVFNSWVNDKKEYNKLQRNK